nr:SMI1/KNR4 family protein [uncultured Kingella sp.]
MKNLISRMQTQLNALVKKYPAAAEELGLSFELNAGTSEADFAELEQTLGYALPEEFKELYRVANGETDIDGVFAGEEWLSIERIIDEYNIWQELYQNGTFQDDGTPYGCEPEAGIKPDFWWNPKWIPLTADGSGNSKMIDLDPSEQGTAGQIIQMWHDDSRREKAANSLREFLENYVRDLEAGLYVLDDEYGVILQSELDDLNDE